ncbi:MAG: YCF48-related protein [Gammaproteobacteria bacterium]
MAASTTEPGAQGPTGRLGLLYAAIACLIGFAGGAWWSWRYAPLPDPFQPAESRTFWQWLTTPIEENAFRRLPVIGGGLSGVFALKGTEHVWAVGYGGLIVHSTDAGETWEQQLDIDWSRAAPKETEPRAENDAFGLIRSAHAGKEPVSLPAADKAKVQARARPVFRQVFEDSLPPAEIPEVQRLLRYLGYDPGPGDGQHGEKTRAAIEKFQRDANLLVDGKLTKELRERLRAESGWTSPGFLDADPPDQALREWRRKEFDAKKVGQTVPGSGSTPPEPSNIRLEPGGSGSRGGGLPNQPPSAHGADLRAVAFANERLGIAVGGNGVILKTEDGGVHWRAATSGIAAGLSSVTFADKKRAVAVGEGGTVLVSTDGGETWKATPTATTASLYSVAFADTKRAVAVGSDGTVLLSLDGGESWKPRISGTGSALSSIDFADANRAAAVGTAGTVLLSIDGGENWVSNKPTVTDFFSVQFPTPDRLVALGRMGEIRLSTDGGGDWQNKVSGTEVTLRALDFLTQKKVVAVGDGGTILRSPDGGETWIPTTWPARWSPVEPTSMQSARYSVKFASPEIVAAVGDQGMALLSTDGGEIWRAMRTGPTGGISSIGFANVARALAVGTPGTLLSWNEGKDSWPILAGIGTPMLFGIDFANADRALAVGSNGRIVISNDGGYSWVTKASGTDVELSAVAFATPDRAVAVGDGGIVLVSTNGGDIWQPRKSGAAAWLRSVAFADEKHAVIVGDSGAIFRSTDGGDTWQAQESGAAQALWSVAFGDADRAVAVGAGGTILLSIDGGQRWQPTESGTEEKLTSVDFGTSNRAIAVGEGRTVLLSSDGGESWRPVEYRRCPAPLFLALSGAALVFGLAGARRAWREAPVEQRTASVTDLFASDRPLRAGERDALDLGAIARGISRFLRNRQTEPPLTIAVTGEWGSGKSSLMGLLHEDLRGRGFRPVWFNAWHHQRGEHLLASLYANIRAKALPPAWTPEGLGFHWDLFLIRARRHWLWLVLTVLLVSLVVSYLYFHLDSTRFLINFAGKNSKELWEEIGKTTLLGGGLLAAVAPALFGLWNGLRAFGLEPKRLLGALGGGQKGVLKAEPGVRYRFAVEFADVSQALKPQTLVIFIDDLDRCTQEHVLEVLECINFLVTAGDCYVVLGMSRRWVETCVGLAFRELAAEAPDEASGSIDVGPKGGAPNQQTSSPPPQADDPRDERRRFARQYLEKLINIEIPVPRVGDGAAASLLVPPLAATPTRRVRAARWLGAKASEWWLPVLLLSVIALGGWLAQLAPDVGSVERSQKDKPADEKPEGVDKRPERRLPPPMGLRIEAETPTPVFLPGDTDEYAPYRHGIAAGVGALALALIIAVLLTRRSRVQTDDSENFRDALEVMQPWIVLGHPSPRLLKRYLNHVRFIAMRQRDDEEPGSLIESLLERLGLVPKPPAPLAPPAGLAEPVLVALSALHQSRPDWQTEPEWLIDAYANLKDGGITEIVNARVEDAGKRAEVMARLKLALEDYNRRFSDHRLFADERWDRQAISALLEAMAGARIDGKVEEPAAPQAFRAGA